MIIDNSADRPPHATALKLVQAQMGIIHQSEAFCFRQLSIIKVQ